MNSKAVYHTMTCRRAFPFAVALILSAASSWATLLPDPQFAAPVKNGFGLGNPPGSLIQSDLADLDGDGDLDFFFQGIPATLRYQENTGSAAVPAFSAPTTMLSVPGYYFHPVFGDLDGDGDLDLLAGTQFEFLFFENTGNSTAPAFAAPVVNPFGAAPDALDYPIWPELADLDGDGDLDIVFATQTKGVFFINNLGNSSSPIFSSYRVPGGFGISPFPSFSIVNAVDIEGDGDLDAFLGGPFHTVCFQRNIGGSTVPSFGLPALDPFGVAPGGFHWAVTTGDLDGDGDFDMITSSSIGSPAFAFWRNTAPIDTTPPVISSITRLGDNPTPNDGVSFAVQFSEPVGNSFTKTDVTTTGSLAVGSIFVNPSPSDPNYTVTVTLSNPDAGGTVGIQVGSSVMDIYENPMASGSSSSFFTITPPGDVNLSGTLDLADVALLADVNLSLATLP